MSRRPYFTVDCRPTTDYAQSSLPIPMTRLMWKGKLRHCLHSDSASLKPGKSRRATQNNHPRYRTVSLNINTPMYRDLEQVIHSTVAQRSLIGDWSVTIIVVNK